MTVAVDAYGKVIGQVAEYARPRNPDAVTHPERWIVVVNRFSQYVDVRRASVRLVKV